MRIIKFFEALSDRSQPYNTIIRFLDLRNNNILMIPSPLQIALKVGITGALAYAIAQFFEFSASFVTPITGGMVILAGGVTGWFLLFQLTFATAFALILGIAEFYTLGNNYLSIFINVLLVSILWRYLNSRGLILGFFTLFLTYSAIVIMTSATDKVTMAYEILMNCLIGIVIGLIINSLFWPISGNNKLEQQLSVILENSQQLCDQIFKGYLLGNYDDGEAQKLRLKILKSYQGSQKLFKVSSFDITGHQLGKIDWPSILKTEANLSLHLSALLHLLQTSKEIDLPKELKIDFKNMTQSLMTCFPELKTVMMSPNNSESFNHCLNQLNQDFLKFSQTLENLKTRSDMKKISISKLLFFYSMVHRLKKLIDELNGWGDQSQNPSLNLSKTINNV